MSRESAWKIVDRRLVADRSPYAMVFDEDVRLPDGELITNWLKVELPPFVIVFAVTEDDQVALVRQYRQAVRTFTYELPSGHIEAGEKAIDAARRELLEEAGVQSANWHYLGKYVMDANRECGWAHIFLARDAHRVSVADPGDLGDWSVHFFPLDELRQMYEAGEFISAPTVLTVGMALHILNQP
jgi:ADP-ribose pyrophosphatase